MNKRVCLVVFALAATALSHAEELPEQVPSTTEVLVREIRSTAPGSLPHQIPVYKGDAGVSNARAAKSLYLHKPIWALVRRADQPYEKKVANGNGERWRMRFMLSSEHVRDFLRNELGTASLVVTDQETVLRNCQ